MTASISHFLDELKKFPNWILHAPDKTPYQINGTVKASPTDPSQWATYDDAVAALQWLPGWGLGFCLTRNANFTVIDLDSYKTQDPAILAEHEAIHNGLNSYSEYSPSGKGIHVWMKGYIPSRGLPSKLFEVYSENHYMTVTGNICNNTPITDQQTQLTQFHAHYWPNAQNGFHSAQANDFPEEESFEILTKQEILQRCADAINSDKFWLLWEGKEEIWNREKYPNAEYKSHSDADLALCNILAFHCDTKNQAKKLYLQSPLAQTQEKSKTRPKWVEDTIRKAFDRKIPTIPGIAQIDAQDWKSRAGVKVENAPTLVVPFDIHNVKDPRCYKNNQVEWIIPGVLAVSMYTLIVGDEGSGKSATVLGMMKSVSEGKPFLGHSIKRRRVMYLDRENPLPSITERFDWLGLEHDNPFLTYFGLHEVGVDPWPIHDKALHEWIKESDDNPVIVIDSLVRFVPSGNDCNIEEVVEFNKFIAALRALGATPIVLHHTGKGESTLEGRGTKDITAGCDLKFILAKKLQIEEKLRRVELRRVRNRVNVSGFVIPENALIDISAHGEFTFADRNIGQKIEDSIDERLKNIMKHNDKMTTGEFDEHVAAQKDLKIPRAFGRKWLKEAGENNLIKVTRDGPAKFYEWKGQVNGES